MLEAIVESRGETMLLLEVAAAGGYCRNTTRRALRRLRDVGFIHRPHGPRKGDTITEDGLAYLGRSAGATAVPESSRDAKPHANS